MKAENIKNMVKRFTDQYGVDISWHITEIKNNSRGVPVITEGTNKLKTAKVLLLKEKFNPLQIVESSIVGLTQDYTRFILTLPDVEIFKDLIITDNHNKKWKLGIVDWFDVGGVPVAKQASLTEIL